MLVRNRGGGLCFIHRDSIVVKKHPLQHTLFQTFECQLLTVRVGKNNSSSPDGVTVAVIYRPPPLVPSLASDAAFYDELSDLFAKVGDVIDSDRFVACGDFNCRGDDSTSIRADLASLISAHGLRQFVTSSTRCTPRVSSLLDLVVGNASSSRIRDVTVRPSHGVSDHDLVTWSLTTRSRPPRRFMTYQFRNIKSIDWVQFKSDILQSDLFTAPAETADSFAEQIDSSVTRILNRHCPLQERSKFASSHRDSRWLSTNAVEMKRARRRLERKWKSSRSNDDYVAYRKACRQVNKEIIRSRQEFYSERINAAGADSRKRWSAMRDVLHLTESSDIRSKDECQKLSDEFAAYFINKIQQIKTTIKSRLAGRVSDPLQSDPVYVGSRLSELSTPTVDEVSRLIRTMPAKSSPIDAIPTSVIKTCVDIFAPVIC